MRYLVVNNDCLWWLEYYGGLAEYLGTNPRCLKSGERIAVFDLDTRPEAASRNSGVDGSYEDAEAAKRVDAHVTTRAGSRAFRH